MKKNKNNQRNSEKNNSPIQLSSSNSTHNRISTITRQRFIYFIPIVLFFFTLASVVIWLPSFFEKESSYYVKKSLVICDTTNNYHFLGTGNKVSIKNRTLILNEDSCEIGDSLLTILYSQYLSKQTVNQPAIIIKDDTDKYSHDSLIIAEIKQDLKICSKNNGKLLYSRGKERFLVNNQSFDSITLRFNNIDFTVHSSAVKLDTIPVSNYQSLPFELMFAFIDKDNNRIAIRFNRIDTKEDTASQKAFISIFPIYGNKLLGKVQKVDTTYLLNFDDKLMPDEVSILRISMNNNPSYALSTDESNMLTVTKDSLNTTPIYAKWEYILTGCLLLLCILSLIGGFIYHRNKKKESFSRSQIEKSSDISYNPDSSKDSDTTSQEDNLDPEKEIEILKKKRQELEQEITNKDREIERLRQIELNFDEEIRKAKEEANQKCDKLVREEKAKAQNEIAEANKKTQKANDIAEAAEKKSREIRQEVTDKFRDEITGLKDELNRRQKQINEKQNDLTQTKEKLEDKEKECNIITRELNNKTEALKSYSARITDVQPAGQYAKYIEKLLQIGYIIEKSADKLLELDTDDYLLTKYISRYHKALHSIDMNQFATDVLNISNVQFVYKQQPIAKYDQHDEKQFKESMKLFFFESYLGKYINAIMVFNETMAGLHYLVDGLTDNETKIFCQYREDLKDVFRDLEIEVHSVKIFDSITDNVDLRVDMRPLEFDCPSGTICQINSCLVYLAGGNKPNDKIHVIVKE